MKNQRHKMSEPVYAFLFLSIFLLLVGISHLLYRYFRISPENSRKFLHVSGGLLALFLPLFFLSKLVVLLLCGLAFLLLLFTYIKNWLPSVHKTIRRSIGSVIFPVPVYICFAVAINKDDDLLFYLPVSFLTISDTVAEWAGRKWGHHSLPLMQGQKTIIGSLGFALSSLLIAMLWGVIFHLGPGQVMIMTMLTAFIATVTELISTKGWDNLTVPLITLGILLLLRNY